MIQEGHTLGSLSSFHIFTWVWGRVDVISKYPISFWGSPGAVSFQDLLGFHALILSNVFPRLITSSFMVTILASTVDAS